MTACLLKNEPTSLFYVACLIPAWDGSVVKARVNSPYPFILLKPAAADFNKIFGQSHGQDPKPGDLAMARLKPSERRVEDRTH